MDAHAAAAAARAPWSDQKGGRHATAVDRSGELWLRRREQCRSGASLVRDVRPGESDRARRRDARVQVHQSALVHHPGGQAAGRQHPALESRRRCSERVGPRRLVEQDAQARRRAQAHDRAVAQRCTGRLLVREQDQAQGRTADPGLAVDSSSVSPPITEWEDNMPARGSIGAVVLARPRRRGDRISKEADNASIRCDAELRTRSERMRVREDNMLDRSATGAVAVAVAVALMVTVGGVQAFDDAKYPNWKGQWTRVMVPGVRGQPGFDPTKPWGPGQQAPLTAEYQKV